MFDKISTALINLLKTNTGIQSVYDYEANSLEGFPAMTIVPSANANDYSTTTENRRAYAFVIRLYKIRGSSSDEQRTTESAMRSLVDTVINTLDANYNMTSLATQSGYTFLKMNPAPSAWGYTERENEMRVAEIRVTLEFDVDTTVIS